jgi:phage recombination protein Bet
MSKVSQFPASDTGAQSSQVSEQRIQKETVLEFLKAFGFTKTLSEAEQNQFIQTALACSLDPFRREIYVAVYGEGENRKVSILTGYQVYLKRAERTGKLDGWQARLEGNGNQMKAVVEIFRKDWSHSFIHEVYWEEAVQKKKDGNPTQFWVKQPRFQLRKVAMAQAFRLAFPDELGGLPYESAELPDLSAGNEIQGSIPADENITSDNRPAKKASKKNEKTSISDSNDDLEEDELDGGRPFGGNAGSKPSALITDADSDEEESERENDFREKTIQQIEGLFEAHPKDFTVKHQAWILDKVNKAADIAGVKKMLAYTEKVVRKAA